MILHFNPNELVAAVGTILKADSTLEGSSYLNGTNNIWSHTIPNNKDGRHLLIETMSLVPGDMGHVVGEVRIHCICDLLMNGQVDGAGNIILDRCEELLNDEEPTITSGRCLPLFSLGIVPCFINEAAGNQKSSGVLRLRAEIGKTA